jgi:NADPH:quinone reductase-like Zn-dependent oxidoreductase
MGEDIGFPNRDDISTAIRNSWSYGAVGLVEFFFFFPSHSHISILPLPVIYSLPCLLMFNPLISTIPTSMSLPLEIKQWVSHQDSIDALKLLTAPLPRPGPGEVLVKINSISINYRDTEVIMGLYNHHSTTGGPAASIVPCSDMCGEIVASNSPRWAVGDKVLSIFNQTHLKGQVKAHHMKHGLGLPLQGVLQEYRVFDAEGLVRKPTYLEDSEAATLPIAGLTAWMAINGMRPLGNPGGKGEIVLIQGTGGVAVSGLQIAKASGAEGMVFCCPSRK